MIRTTLNKYKKNDTQEIKKELIKEITEEIKEYICERCKDPFYTNRDLQSHLNKMTKCKKRDFSGKILRPCKCECGITVSCPGNLTRHMKNCEFLERNKQIDFIDNIPPMIISPSTNNAICAYTRQFNIIGILEDEMTLLEQPGNNFYLTLFEMIHCKKKRSSYHNICYPRNQTRKMLVYTENHCWKELSATEVINRVIFTITNDLHIFSNDILYDKGKQNMRKEIRAQMKSTTKIGSKYKNTMLQLGEGILLLLRKHSLIIEETYMRTNICNSLDSSSTNSSNSASSSSSKSTTKKKIISKSSDSTSSSPSKSTTKKKIISKSSDSNSDNLSYDSTNRSFDSSSDSSLEILPTKSIVNKKIISDTESFSNYPDSSSYNSSDYLFDSSSESQ